MQTIAQWGASRGRLTRAAGTLGVDPALPPPVYIRSNNGSELIAKTVRQWVDSLGVRTLHIELRRRY